MRDENIPLMSVEQARKALEDREFIQVEQLDSSPGQCRRLVEAALLCLEESLVRLARESEAVGQRVPDLQDPSTIVAIQVKRGLSFQNPSDGEHQPEESVGLGKISLHAYLSGPCEVFPGRPPINLQFSAPFQKLKLPETLVHAIERKEMCQMLAKLFPDTEMVHKRVVDSWAIQWEGVLDDWSKANPSSTVFGAWHAELKDCHLEQVLEGPLGKVSRGMRL